jgi:hypothetical protein
VHGQQQAVPMQPKPSLALEVMYQLASGVSFGGGGEGGLTSYGDKNIQGQPCGSGQGPFHFPGAKRGQRAQS